MHFVVAVGQLRRRNASALIKNIAPEKIRIVETVWDDSLRAGGKVLALETDKAFASPLVKIQIGAFTFRETKWFTNSFTLRK